MTYEYGQELKLSDKFFNEFIGGQIYVKCNSRKEAIVFLQYLSEKGVMWVGNDEIVRIDTQPFYSVTDNCYFCPTDEGIGYDSESYVRRHYSHMQLVNYKDLEEYDNGL